MHHPADENKTKNMGEKIIKTSSGGISHLGRLCMGIWTKGWNRTNQITLHDHVRMQKKKKPQSLSLTFSRYLVFLKGLVLKKVNFPLVSSPSTLLPGLFDPGAEIKPKQNNKPPHLLNWIPHVKYVTKDVHRICHVSLKNHVQNLIYQNHIFHFCYPWINLCPFLQICHLFGKVVVIYMEGRNK